jgi:hypothetical protein
MDDQAQAEEDTLVTRPGATRTNKMLATLLGFFTITAPVAASYISYRQAKVEAKTDIKSAHDESEAGYRTVSSPLNQILPIVVQLAGDVAQLKVEITQLKALNMSVATPPAAAVTTPALQPPAGLRPLLRPLPKSLHDAAEQMELR